MSAFKNIEWHFSEAPINQDVGPNDAKFEIFKPDINSLVRESIQNSMDAVDDDSIPVRMSFKVRAVKKYNFSKFFELDEHINGCLDYWGKDAKQVFDPMKEALRLASLKENLYYIEVSDGNTSGMDYEMGNNKTRFHGFLHSTGASTKKSENSGGSFGIGKAAYFAMSPLRTIIVSTMTQEGEHTFQGVSMLCTHTMPDGSLRTPTGFFGNNKEHPMTDESEIPERFKRKEPGTDINIMGIQINNPVEDKARIYEEMKISVLRNFWLAIYNDRLDVTIGDEVIDSSNVIQLVEHYFTNISDNGRKGNVNPRPYLELVSKAKLDDKQYMLIEKTLPLLGDVKFYIFRHPDGRGTIQYFRMPNMMVKREKLPSANNFFSVFICDNPEGDKKLKKLETVAHDDWDAKNWKPRATDGSIPQEAKDVINELETFIRECIDTAFGNNLQDTMEIIGLDKYLYIPTASENDLFSSSEALMSEPTGEFKEDGYSPTTVIDGNPDISKIKLNPLAKGKVYIGTIKKAKSDNSGDLHSGSGERKPKPNPDRHIIPGTGRTNKEDENGLEGNFSRDIDVVYRGIAQKESGQYFHYLKITSPEDIENGRIVVTTGREYGAAEPLNIIWAEGAETYKNSIYNLRLKKGANTVKIQFADNLSHTLTLEVYENK